MRAMTALHSVQMPLERYDRNGDEIKPGMHLVTDDGDKMFVFSLPSLYIVADQGSREANLAYAAECIRTGQGEFYPLDFLLLQLALRFRGRRGGGCGHRGLPPLVEVLEKLANAGHALHQLGAHLV